MGFARLGVVLACSVPFVVGCSGAGAQGSNLAIAGTFVAAAAAAQVAQTVAEENAKRNASVAHASGTTTGVLSPGCDNDGQYGCLTVQPGVASGSADGAAVSEMTDDEVRDYVLQYLNGVRKLNGVPLLVRDGALDAFAQSGSDELALDHRAGAHLQAHREDVGAGGEVQGPAEGYESGGLQDGVGEILLRFMNEGAGGADHDAVLRPQWRKLGVGVVNRGGRTFLTVDFSS